MSARTTLLDEALDLPPDERAELAAKLIESLPEPQAGDGAPISGGGGSAEGGTRDVAESWDAEVRRRVGRMLDGDAKGTSSADARARILERLARR